MDDYEVMARATNVLAQLEEVGGEWEGLNPSSITIGIHLPSWEMAVEVLRSIQSITALKVELLVDFNGYEGYQYVFRF